MVSGPEGGEGGGLWNCVAAVSVHGAVCVTPTCLPTQPIDVSTAYTYIYRQGDGGGDSELRAPAAAQAQRPGVRASTSSGYVGMRGVCSRQ